MVRSDSLTGSGTVVESDHAGTAIVHEEPSVCDA